MPSVEEQLSIIETQVTIVYYDGYQRIYDYHQQIMAQSIGEVIGELSAPSSVKFLRVFPCQYELEIIEACPFNNPMKDIHHCGFEGHDFDRCMRGEVSYQKQKEIQSCSNCEHHKEPT